MRISANLAALALRQLVNGACGVIGVPAGEGAVEGVVGFLLRRFLDHSQKLTEALRLSNERSWKALEVALAGDSLWDRCKLVLAPGEEKAFRELVGPFLSRCDLAMLHGREPFRRLCLAELRAARKDGLLTEGALDPAELARKAGTFARFGDPTALLAIEGEVLSDMGVELKQAGYVNLAEFVALRPTNGEAILVLASRYFFRREVETDPVLFRGLTFAQLEKIQQEQMLGFDALRQALDEQGDRLERMLGEVQAVVAATHGAVLDIRAEQRKQGDQARDIYQAVIDLQHRLDMVHREVRPADSLSLRNDQERSLVKQLVARYRSLPEGNRQSMPALLNAIGKLEVAAGDFQAARADFVEVGALASEPRAQAEAHHNAYRAALEARDWTSALAELREAARLDPGRFAPFPLDKYRPQRILGAGGFGVAFLCEHRFLKAPVVLKTLSDDDLDRGIDTVFAEAHVLRQLDHPAIIRLQDCGFGSPDGEARPYLVMDFFEGTTLEDLVREKPLSVDELVRVASPVASGLMAAHTRHILHRDVKPANLLVRRPSSPTPGHREDPSSWSVKVIDFGLALRRTGRETMLATSRTLTGLSIAGTIDYAAPEQMGKLSGVGISPASDVYGFARTCCYALFQTPQPLMRHWRALPGQMAELLEACLEEQPGNRPQSFAEILGVLDRVAGVPTPTPASAPAPSPAPVPPTIPVTDDPRRQELTVLAQRVAGCTRCSALARTRQKTVFGAGPVEPTICFVGEAPGADEDRTGQPFVGASGQLLTRLLGEVGIDRASVWLTNLLKCRPPGNRKPEPAETQNCREHLLRELELLRPRSIVCLGAPASQGLLGTTEFIGRLRGRIHDFRGIPVLCTYHPAFLLPGRSPQKASEVIADLRLLQQHLAGSRTG